MFNAEQIAARVQELADQINAEYAGKRLLVIGVLKGAWMFMADLIRKLDVPAACDFVRVSSYGARTVTSGKPSLLLDITEKIEGRDVLVVEDIMDTGVSLAWLMKYLRQQDPSSLRLCVLLDKPSRRQQDVEADYIGFEIPNKFVVGYGVDYAEHFRELPYIGYVVQDD
jgi:hypoxanthine phosphoribosyltransferase